MTEQGSADQGSAEPDSAETGFLIRPRAIWGVLGAVLVLAAVPWVRHEMVPSLIRQPEPFSAIAFADPVRPIDCRTGRTVIAVTNHVGVPKVYRFTTSVLRAGHPATVSHGQVTVADGATSSATIRVQAVTTGVTGKAQAYSVAVALDGAGERVRANCAREAS